MNTSLNTDGDCRVSKTQFTHHTQFTYHHSLNLCQIHRSAHSKYEANKLQTLLQSMKVYNTQ